MDRGDTFENIIVPSGGVFDSRLGQPTTLRYLTYMVGCRSIYLFLSMK